MLAQHRQLSTTHAHKHNIILICTDQKQGHRVQSSHCDICGWNRRARTRVLLDPRGTPLTTRTLKPSATDTGARTADLKNLLLLLFSRESKNLVCESKNLSFRLDAHKCILSDPSYNIKSQLARSAKSARRTSCEATRAREASSCEATSLRSRQGARSAASDRTTCASSGLSAYWS